MPRVGILTVSDRSFKGQRVDLSGPAIRTVIEENGWQVAEQTIVPDEVEHITSLLVDWTDVKRLDLILTTGGTGFSPRDVTPEATLQVIHRQAPGLAEKMRFESLKVTPHAALSRAVAGIRAATLIINLPGSPKAAVENLDFVLPVLHHALDLLRGDPTAESRHNTQFQCNQGG